MGDNSTAVLQPLIAESFPFHNRVGRIWGREILPGTGECECVWRGVATHTGNGWVKYVIVAIKSR